MCMANEKKSKFHFFKHIPHNLTMKEMLANVDFCCPSCNCPIKVTNFSTKV